jgi:apolipoprotein N-acyltransferase
MAEPFTETQLTASVPVVQETSLYVRYGDFLPYLCIIAAVFFGAAGLFKKTSLFSKRAL